ncbi:2,3,4,5-tetrahydropyridine-2,6-dicarboxylate N-succinyltransferase [Rickettsiales bacterium LUAb2]
MLAEIITNLYTTNPSSLNSEQKVTIDQVISKLNTGEIRVAEKNNGIWQVNQWVKQAILLYLKYSSGFTIDGNSENSYWFDKVPNKFLNWQENDFIEAKLRTIPMSYVRSGCYLGKNVIVMPSFINMGAYVDDGTMVDSFVTVGSCAQIGKKCHLSADVCIGGVLEPLQANPVIIEDNCFIGAGSKILEGVIVKQNAVVGAGVVISATTKIIDRETGDIFYGEVPENSVVIPGSIIDKNNIALTAAIIVKKADEKTRGKTSINELLRY